MELEVLDEISHLILVKMSKAHTTAERAEYWGKNE
jgi:hypothetical protein